MESTTFSSGDDRSGWGKLDGISKPASDSEWHSIPLEDASRAKGDCSFQQIGEQRTSQQGGRKLDAARGGLSKLVICRDSAGDAEAESLVGHPSKNTGDGVAVSVETSESLGGCKEVRLSFHGLEGPCSNTSEKIPKRTGPKQSDCTSGASLGCGYEGCLPLLPQVRAFIKGAKLSCSGLLSGDGKMLFLDSWGSLLQRSFSMRQSDSSASESELFCKEPKTLARAVSMPPLAVTPSGFSSGIAEANVVAKGATPLANDLQSRADALPLAHYRPLDAVPSWKGGDGQQAVPVKSPVNINSKKPPKPPRHPGRTASLDSATVAAQRAAKKCREKASSKRKARTGSPVAGTGVTPLVALVLTIGFGILMMFQGVFVQTNAAYGRDANRAYVDPAFNLRTSILAHRSALDPHPLPHHIDEGALGSAQASARKLGSDQGASGSAQAEASKSEAILSNAFHKSMEELAWSRRSLAMPTE